jgi:diguanylate cyclase (GGDEF)-like protein
MAGHPVGDEALMHVVRRLRSARRSAPIGRLGGEEFAIMLPAITTAALNVADACAPPSRRNHCAGNDADPHDDQRRACAIAEHHQQMIARR